VLQVFSNALSNLAKFLADIAGAVDSLGTILTLLFGGYVGGRASVVARFRLEQRWDLLATHLTVLRSGLPAEAKLAEEWESAMVILNERVPMLAWADRQLWARVLGSVPTQSLPTIHGAATAPTEVHDYWTKRLAYDRDLAPDATAKFDRATAKLEKHWQDRVNPSFSARARLKGRSIQLIATIRPRRGWTQRDFLRAKKALYVTDSAIVGPTIARQR